MKNTIENVKKWVNGHIPATIAASIAILALIALPIAWANGAFDSNVADNASKPRVTAEVPTGTEKTPLKIDVAADEKVNEASTPTIVHVQSTDKRSEPVDFYHAVDSGKKTDTVEVSPGDYKMTVTGVINNDGSVAKPAKESKEIAVSIKSTAQPDKAENKADVGVKLDETIPADKVTADDVKEIVEDTKTAIENGDSSLKGDAGKAILEKVEANAKANENLGEDTKAVVAESTEKAKESTQTEAKATVTVAPESASKAAPAEKPAPAPKPAEKQKVWVEEKGHYENITEKVWVPNVVTIVDKPAWDEKVETDDAYFVFSDGYIAQNVTDARAYDKKMLKAGTPVSYSVQIKYKTVHHDAVTHTEDRGHWENKVTGQKWVVDVPGHWE